MAIENRVLRRPWACDLHRRKLDRLRCCKVFEIGLSRTASRSVFKAVDRMGLQAMHGFGSCLVCEFDALDKLTRGFADFDVYRCYDYCGQVTFVHWKKIAEENPDAKFVLTIRDVVPWLESMRLHAFRAWRKSMRGKSRLWSQMVWKSMYDVDDEDWNKVVVVAGQTRIEAESALMFKIQCGWNRHHAEVFGYFSGINSDRLLVLNVFEESNQVLWNRLAEFIGCDPPEEGTRFPKITGPIRRFRHQNLFLGMEDA